MNDKISYWAAEQTRKTEVAYEKLSRAKSCQSLMRTENSIESWLRNRCIPDSFPKHSRCIPGSFSVHSPPFSSPLIKYLGKPCARAAISISRSLHGWMRIGLHASPLVQCVVLWFRTRVSQSVSRAQRNLERMLPFRVVHFVWVWLLASLVSLL